MGNNLRKMEFMGNLIEGNDLSIKIVIGLD